MNEPYRLHYSRIPRTFVPKLSPKQKKKTDVKNLVVKIYAPIIENICE